MRLLLALALSLNFLAWAQRLVPLQVRVQIPTEKALLAAVAPRSSISDAAATTSVPTIRLICGAPIVANKPPLFVINDSIVLRDNSINLQPKDIAQVKVLKGGNAIARYGQQAAGGAILIELKRRSKFLLLKTEKASSQ